ncbi:MAG: NAD(P)H-dependent oxidoreductase [Candidatus Bathyarchaeia archaeon]
MDYEIIQLVEKEIKFCNLCGRCAFEECLLDDDFNQILKKMIRADGIIFSFPYYLPIPSKFLCFLERLDIIRHFRKHHGYSPRLKPNKSYVFPLDKKPCCIFIVSGTGKIKKGYVKIVTDILEGLGMEVIQKVYLKGEEIGEVLKDKKGLANCKKSIQKLMKF